MSTSDASEYSPSTCNGDWQSVFKNTNSAPARLNPTLNSVKSCSTASDLMQQPSAYVLINDVRVKNNDLAKRVNTLEDTVNKLSYEIQRIANVGCVNGKHVSVIHSPESSSEDLDISVLTSSDSLGGKRSRRRRRKSLKGRKQSKKNHRKTRR
jgi:hypothetical protein